MHNLYKEDILEHYNSPQNFGKLQSYTHSSKQKNPLCGDEIEMYTFFKEEILKDISFNGVGCAISIAAASLLTEFSKGKTQKLLTKFREKDMLNLLGIEVSESRKKCAFLPLSALKDCLHS